MNFHPTKRNPTFVPPKVSRIVKVLLQCQDNLINDVVPGIRAHDSEDWDDIQEALNLCVPRLTRAEIRLDGMGEAGSVIERSVVDQLVRGIEPIRHDLDRLHPMLSGRKGAGVLRANIAILRAHYDDLESELNHWIATEPDDDSEPQAMAA